MANPMLSPLLALPREICDMIIDNMLLSPRPAPTPASQKVPLEEEPERWSTVDVPPVPPLTSLARTSAQLRAETLQRAATLDTPLILEILVLKNGNVKCTWIQRPCKPPLEWQKIDLKVQV